ncbi:DUF2240 family protein [Salinirubellus sp. GCM10025818]|uniref:DUF2240 family protein n=1 Tax=Salinirubellus TaxID=2162630 RepID=UPI0030CB0727
MSLRVVVAAPFRREGRERVTESDFIVDLSMKRGWFTPEQARRVVDVAISEGLVERGDADSLVATFEPREASIPEGFTPEESVVQRRSTFERVLDALTDAGHEKQEAVAAVNRLQSDLGLTVEAVGVLYARRQGIDVDALAERALAELEAEG